MELIKNSNILSTDFFVFYTASRLLKNEISTRYRIPSDEELLLNLKNNLEYILEFEIH